MTPFTAVWIIGAGFGAACLAIHATIEHFAKKRAARAIDLPGGR